MYKVETINLAHLNLYEVKNFSQTLLYNMHVFHKIQQDCTQINLLVQI